MGRQYSWQTPQVVSPSPSQGFVLVLSTSGSSVKISLVFFSGMLAILIVLIILVIIWKCIKPQTLQKIMRSTKRFQAFASFRNLRSINHFDLRTLKKATEDFHPKNEIGKGGFGTVYKGVLGDGRLIAVKQLYLGKSRHGESQFLAEVRMITSIQHKNLVRLLGCCSEGAERLLVYEYMDNGSLDNMIFGKKEKPLCWENQFQIILGVARGLQYLHEESNLKIVHRDVKASNVLLDDKFQPKISDFGLARFFLDDQTSFSSSVAGTLGYTAPEYAIKGELSEKADVYSFGVLVLEIICRRMNTDLTLPAEMQYLPDYAWKLYERSRIKDLVDPKSHSDGFTEKDMVRVCNVAMLCLQPHPSSRPPMSDVVSMLTWKSDTTTAALKFPFMDRIRRLNRLISQKIVCEIRSSPL